MEAVLYVLLFLVVLFVLLSIGSWIAVALGLAGTMFLYFFLGAVSVDTIGTVVFNTWTNYSLVALPLFIFMASVLSSSGVGERLYSGSASLFSRFPGGLLHANIMASAGFGAVCGSTMATTAAIGGVAMPYMEREKYPERLATGTLLAGGGLGIMIPPSGGFIIYSMLSGQSVGRLFMAGILPGLMMASIFIVYIGIFCKVTKQPIPTYKQNFKRTVLSLLSTWPVVLLFLAIMGSIFFGVTTATEAAAMGALFSVIIAAVLKKFSKENMTKAFSDGLKTTVMIFFITAGGMVVGAALNNLGVPHQLSSWVLDHEFSQIQVVIAISVMYLLLGCVFESTAALVSTVPTVLPMMVSVGIHPIWFGVALIVYCEMAAITPPIGVNLFVMQGITGKPMDKIIGGIFPFVLLYLLSFTILYIFPSIALFLPSIMY